MSLMRLLSAGKSFVGGEDNSNRYRMAAVGALPKFGSPKNPFLPTPKLDPVTHLAEATTNGPIATLECKKVTESETTRPIASCAPEGQPERADSEPVSAAVAAALATNVPGGKVGQKGLSPISAVPVQKRADAPPSGGGSWLGKLWTRVTKRGRKPVGQPPRQAAAQDVKTPVQTELSLDMVRVMRNDLSDADIEIVPQASRRPAPKNDLSAGIDAVASAGLANAGKA